MGAPGTAKNAITVGASESHGRDLYSNQPGEDYLAYFSSRGPASDGRAKPDVVGPGYSILSSSARPDEVGECDGSSNGDGIPLVGEDTSAYGISYKAGTSMAAPGVAGIALLIQQYFQEGYYPTGTKLSANAHDANISAALIKAVIMNGAQSLKGIGGGGTNSGDTNSGGVSYYDVHQGYGRVNLLQSVPLMGYNDFYMNVTDRAVIANDEVHEIHVAITTAAAAAVDVDGNSNSNSTMDMPSQCNMTELSVTLAWTDPSAAVGCTSCLINDLDLTVSKLVSVYNNTTNTTNTTAAAAIEEHVFYANGGTNVDTLNNVERVRVNASLGDEFLVRVTGSNLATQNQTYALVVTGCFDIDAGNDGDGNAVPLDMKELVTTYDAQNGEAGNMFDVVSLYGGGAIEILEMDIHIHTYTAANTNDTAAIDYYTAMIYTKEGSHVGYENSDHLWTMVTDGADGVQISASSSSSHGNSNSGIPTSLPRDAFAPIIMAKNTTLAFYVTLTTPHMEYSDGTAGVGSVFASNADLQILEGAGVAYPFGTCLSPRVWNGALRYRKVADGGGTGAAADRPVVLEELVTTFSGDNGEAGNMFDVVAFDDNDVEIYEISIHVSTLDLVECEIYTKAGSYGNETAAAALSSSSSSSSSSHHYWNMTGYAAAVQGNGVGSPTHLPWDTLFEPILISAGDVHAFYVTLTTPDLHYSDGAAVGNVAASNMHLQILEGAGVAYSFGQSLSPRVWNGALYYTVIDVADDGDGDDAGTGISASSSSSDEKAPNAYAVQQMGLSKSDPDELEMKVTSTTFQGTSTTLNHSGMMFDVSTGGNSILIHEFDIHTEEIGGKFVEVYTKSGSFVGHEIDRSAWTNFAPADGKGIAVDAMGPGTPTTIPAGSFEAIYVPSYSTQGFYVAITDSNQAWSFSTNDIGSVASELDGGVHVLVGKSVPYPFKSTGNGPREWNGAIRYEVM